MTKECLTPLGMKILDDALGTKVLRAYGAGTSCVDVSCMGSQLGLFGPSCRSLAIWLSEIRVVQPVPQQQQGVRGVITLGPESNPNLEEFN